MITATMTCPKCGNEMNLKIDPTCPQEWAEKLVKLAICNACADKRYAVRAEADDKWWRKLKGRRA